MEDLNEIWTEKYRPKKIAELSGQKNIKERLQAFANEKSIPHLLFAGTAGIGKTTCALALAKEIYGDNWHKNFMETNASDERGINVVRTTIKDFARVKPFGAEFKIVFLDECDALTPEAQQALRRTMEKYTKTTRFILSCNYSSKLIPPIQSRCAIFRFRPLEDEDIKESLTKITKNEGLELTDSGTDAILAVAEGDMRKAVNTLQSVAITSKKITNDEVYSIAASLRPEEVKEILELALNNQFMESRKKLANIMLVRGLSGIDVIKGLHKQIIEIDIDETKKAILIDKLGEYEFRIVEGGTEDLQMEAFLAQVSTLSN
ncbi:replication factor C small subunit [archaeon]|nr:replication factor C small subunit [archaeon]